jgi:hypothetical protein
MTRSSYRKLNTFMKWYFAVGVGTMLSIIAHNFITRT